MADDWEDWENEDFSIPNLTIKCEEELKKFEERRLVEESDEKITRQLFGYEDEDECKEKNHILKFTNKNNDIIIQPIRNKKSTVSNQKENEEKMKERAKKFREQKAKKMAEKELYGEAEAEADEYDDYAAKFD
jgi:hypothetical protein